MVRSQHGRLLAHPLLCYKPDMRKWMRDRLQRRKKKAPEKTGQAPPPPLQPAYFDAEQSAENPVETRSREEEALQDEEPAPIAASAERDDVEQAPTEQDAPPKPVRPASQ